MPSAGAVFLDRRSAKPRRAGSCDPNAAGILLAAGSAYRCTSSGSRRAGAGEALAFAAIRASVTPGVAIGAVIVALLALALFVKVEARQGAAALVPLDIFQVRQFRGAMTAMVGMTFGGYGMLFVLPLAWQSTGVLETVGAGLALMPMAVMFARGLRSPGAMIARFGERLLASGGVAVMGTGLLLIAPRYPSQRSHHGRSRSYADGDWPRNGARPADQRGGRRRCRGAFRNRGRAGQCCSCRGCDIRRCGARLGLCCWPGQGRTDCSSRWRWADSTRDRVRGGCGRDDADRTSRRMGGSGAVVDRMGQGPSRVARNGRGNRSGKDRLR